MKINGYSSPPQAGQANQAKNDPRVGDKPSTGGDAGPAAVSHISNGGTDHGRDVNSARVAEIRQAIAEGRLEFRADRIADRLIASLQDLPGQAEP